MTFNENRCQYSFEIDKNKGKFCPFDKYDDGNYCIFHTDTDKKRNTDVVQKIHQIAESDSKQDKQILEGKFSELNLSYQTISSENNYPIHIQNATIEGDVDFSSATLEIPFLLLDVEIEGHVNFNATSCEKQVRIKRADIQGTVAFRGAEFTTGLQLQHTTLHDSVDIHHSYFFLLHIDNSTVLGKLNATFNSIFASTFHHTEFAGKIEFDHTSFENLCMFDKAELTGGADFTEVSFQGHTRFNNAILRNVLFRRCDFARDAWFQDMTCKGYLYFYYVNFDGVQFTNSVFEGEVDIGNTTFKKLASFESTVFKDKTTITGCKFEREAAFGEIWFDSEVQFDRSVFEGIVSFDHSNFYCIPSYEACVFKNRMSFSNVNLRETADFYKSIFEYRFECKNTSIENDHTKHIRLTEAVIEGGVLGQPAEEYILYDLADATLGDVDLEPSGENNLFEYYRFINTDFEGFDFSSGKYQRPLSNNWELHTTLEETEEVDVEYLISTYLKAKNGANKVGAHKAAAEFFRKEMIYRRKQHHQNFKSSTTKKEKIGSGIDWLANFSLGAIAGHGEKPTRVIGFTFLIISIYFGLLKIYRSYSPQITFHEQLPIVINDIVDVSLILSLASSALLAFLVSVFVLTLTRSIHR